VDRLSRSAGSSRIADSLADGRLQAFINRVQLNFPLIAVGTGCVEMKAVAVWGSSGGRSA
jgi:hypothetical protein